MELGSYPDWLQAFGATGALIYIAIQAHRDRDNILWERQRDREAREETNRLRRDAEAAQARLVSFNLTMESGEVLDWVVTVHNDSDRAIRDLRISVFGPDGKELQPAGTQRYGDIIARPSNILERIDPGQDAEIRFTFEGGVDDIDDGDPEPDEGCSWAVYFTDAAGHRWRRRGTQLNATSATERIFES